MNVKEITTMVTSVIIAIIVTVTVLVPIVGTAIENQHEYYNNSIGQFSKVIDEPIAIEFTYDANDGISYTVNGVDQSLLYNYNDIIFATSHASFKITYSSSYSSYLLWLDDAQSSNRIDNPKSVSAEIDVDSISVSFVKADNTTDSFEVGIDWGFYAVTTGDYRAVWNDPYNVYINDINQVYSVNWIATTTEFFSIHGESVVYGGGNATVSYDLTPVSGVIDVYNFMSGDFILTVDNNGTPYEAVPFNVIVPVEIIGDKDTYSDVLDTILAILPIFVILGLLVGIAFYFKRT